MDKLGKKLRDKVTGYTGVCGVVETSPFTMTRYHLAAPVNDKEEIPPGYSFDDSDLEVLDEGKLYLEIIPEEPTTIKFLDKVEDIITGYRGTVASKLVYANGCVRWNVLAKDKDRVKDEKPGRTIPNGRLIVTKAATQPKTETPVRTGGPSERSPSNLR